MRFYSIKNRYVDSFNTPFACENDKMAIYTVRQFMNEQKEPTIIPMDFSLYFVGQFDESSGCFSLPDSPVVLIDDCTVLVVKEPIVKGEIVKEGNLKGDLVKEDTVEEVVHE